MYPERLDPQHCADCGSGSLALWSVPGRRTKKPSSLPTSRHRLWVKMLGFQFSEQGSSPCGGTRDERGFAPYLAAGPHCCTKDRLPEPPPSLAHLFLSGFV